MKSNSIRYVLKQKVKKKLKIKIKKYLGMYSYNRYRKIFRSQKHTSINSSTLNMLVEIAYTPLYIRVSQSLSPNVIVNEPSDEEVKNTIKKE